VGEHSRCRMSKDQARRKRKVAEGNGDGTGLSNDVIDIQAKLEGGYVNEVTSRKGRNYKSLKQLAGSENFELLPPEVPTYYNIDSPPSTLPPKKYCDLTGFKVCISYRTKGGNAEVIFLVAFSAWNL